MWEIFCTIFLFFGVLYAVAIYFDALWKVAPWKSKADRVSFWINSWKDKFLLGVFSVLFAVITPFMFYFILIYDYIPNGKYRIAVDVSGYELPCDLVVNTEESEYLEKDGETKTSYYKSFYLDTAYWANGGQLVIDEYIDPNGDKLEIYNCNGVYTVKTPKITQEFLGIDTYDIVKERLFKGNGILFIVLEIAAVYMSVQFLSVSQYMQST